MFIGEYSHSVDAKGRIIIPSKFRDELHSTFILTRGIDNCLTIYSQEQWAKVLQDLEQFPNTKKVARQFIHVLASRACECEPDKMGRIQIPSYLANEVHITKECAIVGAINHVEIWDKETWKQYYDQASAHFEEVSEDLSELLNHD